MHTQTFTHTILATGNGVQKRFVNYAGAQAGAVDQALGVAMTDFKIGEAFTAHIVGVVAVEAGGAVAVGAPVAPDANGRGISVAENAANIAGRALNAVAAAGETLFIKLK